MSINLQNIWSQINLVRNREGAMLTEESKRQLSEWAHNLPKIDLHRHLEGSLRLKTLADIAIEHGIVESDKI